MEIHKKIFHGDQQFKDRHRPIEHFCRKENEQLKFNTLIETNIQDKYRDKKGKEYTDIENFLNLKSKEEKKKYIVPQGGRKNNQGKNNKQKGRREGRKMQKGRKQREPRGGGGKNRTSSGNTPCIQ